jgi:hypothetical protein
MQAVLRVIVGIAGTLGVLIALRIWMAPTEVAAQLGVTPVGPLGLATIRADMAGFFGGVGALSVFAAIRGQGRLLTAPLLLIGLALTGRVVTILMSGFSNEMLPPMVVELVLVLILAAGRSRLRA